MITIGFDATSAVSQGGGIGRYTRELLRALAAVDTDNLYRIFYAARRLRESLPTSLPNHTITHLPVHDIWLARVWHRAQLPLAIDWLIGPVDVFHSPDFTLPPVSRCVRTLLTVHDLSFIRDPASAAPGLRHYLEIVVPRSVARATHILADSETTRQDLIELYRTHPEKISVLYAGVNEFFRPERDRRRLLAVRERYGLGTAPFILAVGTLQPRKNYVRLVKAFACLPQRECRLVIAGGKGWLYDEIFAEVERQGLRERVVFCGFVADADLPALYSAAQALAYPSLYEGFGLPMLEAMACGVPVVASTAACLPEVAGEAALLVPPTDVDALASALERVLTDEELRARLIAAGFERVRHFRWDAAARQLVEIYRKLL